MLSFTDKESDKPSSQEKTLDTTLQLARSSLTDQKIRKIVQFKRDYPAIAEAFPTVNLAVLSNATTDLLGPPLEAAGVRYRFNLELFLQAYNQWKFQVHNSDYELYSFNPDYILIAESHHDLTLNFTDQHFTAQGKEDLVSSRIEELKIFVSHIQKNTNAQILFQTVPLPSALSLGIGEQLVEGSTTDIILDYNERLVQFAKENGHYIVDINRLSQDIGLRHWHDERLWDLAKIAFATKWIADYGDYILRTINAIKGKTGRCLILDLDNTIWGGVVGDLGVQSVEIGTGSANGEAFLRLQQVCLQLKKRGIVLAVCSKNDEPLAKEVFTDNPNMLLKLDDVSVFKANWQPKAENISEIASELSLGIANMVFLDDNPVERFQVRQRLPDVIVPEIGTDPSEYARDLLSCGAFDCLELTEADFERSTQYQANKERANLEATSTDQNNFLVKLETVVEYESFNETNKQRVYQLINKSNQFNLTTIRYTLNELEGFSDDTKIFTFKAHDRFGSHGLISVLILKGLDTDNPYIDTWCMSCRVLKRKIEEAIMSIVFDFCKSKGYKKLKATYIRTKKNDMVSAVFEELYFSCDHQSYEHSEWHMMLEHMPLYNPPIKVILS